MSPFLNLYKIKAQIDKSSPSVRPRVLSLKLLMDFD
jgi:hypothetical protein